MRYIDVLSIDEEIGLASELPLSETQFLIMTGVVEPAHGYGIMKHVEHMTEGRVVIGPGTMYGTLKRLEKWKLIRRIPEDNEDGRRIVYQLTDQGRRLLMLESKRLSSLAKIAENTVKVLGEVYER